MQSRTSLPCVRPDFAERTPAGPPQSHLPRSKQSVACPHLCEPRQQAGLGAGCHSEQAERSNEFCKHEEEDGAAQQRWERLGP